MGLTIEPVAGKAQLTEFIRLPRRLYQDMPGFVPPLDMERREMIDPRKNPFFSHGRAAYWIARRDGQAVGRISAQIDELAGPQTPEHLGQFGCLDTADDREAVSALLRAAEDWLKERGCRRIRGPFILSINGESGLLIEGQTQPPMLMLPWHPAYLEAHVLGAGYRRAMRLLSYSLDLSKPLSRSRSHTARIPEHGFSVRSMSLRNFGEEMEIARSIYNDGWQQNWGFVPGSAADAKGLADAFKPLLLPDCGFFICSEDQPIAFAFAAPNIFDISSDIGAAPSPVGWLKLAWRLHRKRYRSFRLVFIGGKTAYHGTGIGEIALCETIQRVRRYHAEELVCAWVLESNAALIRALERFGFSAKAVFGLYEKS